MSAALHTPLSAALARSILRPITGRQSLFLRLRTRAISLDGHMLHVESRANYSRIPASLDHSEKL
eukprot:637678-Amphidinium_carterae.1